MALSNERRVAVLTALLKSEVRKRGITEFNRSDVKAQIEETIETSPDLKKAGVRVEEFLEIHDEIVGELVRELLPESE